MYTEIPNLENCLSISSISIFKTLGYVSLKMNMVVGCDYNAVVQCLPHMIMKPQI